MDGKLLAIARRGERRAPMEEVSRVAITRAFGVEGDHKGSKFPKRQVTVLAAEDWRAALMDLGLKGDAAPWTVRRANLLVEGLRLPRAPGAVLRIGSSEIEVTAPTFPCKRMDEAIPGLLKALYPDWRGGVTGRVLSDGEVAVGDNVVVVSSPPERHRRRLPK